MQWTVLQHVLLVLCNADQWVFNGILGPDGPDVLRLTVSRFDDDQSGTIEYDEFLRHIFPEEYVKVRPQGFPRRMVDPVIDQ